MPLVENIINMLGNTYNVSLPNITITYKNLNIYLFMFGPKEHHALFLKYDTVLPIVNI